MNRLPWFTLGCAVLAVLFALVPGAAEWLQLDRTALAHGQLWRVITGHFTHFDRDHLTWDLAALLLLGALSEAVDRAAWRRTMLFGALAISAGVLLGQPGLRVYRGLSGLDSALFGLVVARLARDGWRSGHGFSLALAALAGGGFLLKCGYEIGTGSTYFAAGTTYVPVPLAHGLGFLSGIVGAVHRPQIAGTCTRGETSVSTP